MKRVVISGIGGISALGRNWASIRQGLAAYENAVVARPEWDRYPELNTRLAAPIRDFTVPAHWTR